MLISRLRIVQTHRLTAQDDFQSVRERETVLEGELGRARYQYSASGDPARGSDEKSVKKNRRFDRPTPGLGRGLNSADQVLCDRHSRSAPPGDSGWSKRGTGFALNGEASVRPIRTRAHSEHSRQRELANPVPFPSNASRSPRSSAVGPRRSPAMNQQGSADSRR